MFSGQFLLLDNAVYSPWMDRRGDLIFVTAELILQTPDTWLNVSVFHKNLEELGPGTQLGAVMQITEPQTKQQGYQRTKELVRFKFECAYKTGQAGQTYDYVLFRQLRPIWFDSLSA